jgi:hypothetical protein
MIFGAENALRQTDSSYGADASPMILQAFGSSQPQCCSTRLTCPQALKYKRACVFFGLGSRRMVISHVLLVVGSGKFGPQQAIGPKGEIQAQRKLANVCYRMVEGKCKARVPGSIVKYRIAMVLKRAKPTPRLSLSRPQTLKSLSQVFGLVEWLKGYPCRRGDR